MRSDISYKGPFECEDEEDDDEASSVDSDEEDEQTDPIDVSSEREPMDDESQVLSSPSSTFLTTQLHFMFIPRSIWLLAF